MQIVGIICAPEKVSLLSRTLAGTNSAGSLIVEEKFYSNIKFVAIRLQLAIFISLAGPVENPQLVVFGAKVLQ